MFFAWSLGVEAHIHIKHLGIFGICCRLPGHILHEVALSKLFSDPDSSTSWFILVQEAVPPLWHPLPSLATHSSSFLHIHWESCEEQGGWIFEEKIPARSGHQGFFGLFQIWVPLPLQTSPSLDNLLGQPLLLLHASSVARMPLRHSRHCPEG